MYKLLSNKTVRFTSPILFFSFICWIIYDADRGDYNTFIEIGKSMPHSDKLFHALLYGILAYLTNIGLNLKRIKIGGKSILLGAFLVMLFALGEEVTQIPFETRDFDLLDILSDIIGIIGFSWLAVYQYKLSLRKT